MAALHGRTRKKTRRIPSARPGASGEATDVSTITRSERTGLSSLLLQGWNVEWDSAMRVRLWRGAHDTGFFEDEKQACQAARLLAEQEEGE